MADYFVHESAVVDAGAHIGAGTRIWHFCHLMPGSRIGERCVLGQNVVVSPDVVVGNGCKIQNNVSLYSGVTLDDEVFLGPSMVFTNVANPRAFIGANATIICGVTLGSYCFVGAGAVVTRNVPDHALVHGAPARTRGWVCVCGEKLALGLGANAESGACAACGRRYLRDGGRVRLA
jgi:UDP-2-acetamido-3-amino-2,3-dideoxy-glucuronate N-acetyltransferase